MERTVISNAPTPIAIAQLPILLRMNAALRFPEMIPKKSFYCTCNRPGENILFTWYAKITG